VFFFSLKIDIIYKLYLLNIRVNLKLKLIHTRICKNLPWWILNLTIHCLLQKATVCQKTQKIAPKTQQNREVAVPVELRGLRLSKRKTFSTLGVAMCSISLTKWTLNTSIKHYNLFSFFLIYNYRHVITKLNFSIRLVHNYPDLLSMNRRFKTTGASVA
jgi:hypothetical protein